MPERPPPAITVTIPGRGAAPEELLAVGPPPSRRPRRPRLPLRLRGLLAAVLLVLAGGVLTAVQQEQEQVPPRPAARGQAVQGVTASAQLDEQREQVVRLALRIVLAGEETGRGDTNGPSEPEQLRLLDVRVRGYQVRLVGRSLPLRLGDVGRFGSGLRQVVPLDAEIVVADCSVDVRARRTITLRLQRSAAPPVDAVVQAGEEVVRALDDLVRRACRRPRG